MSRIGASANEAWFALIRDIVQEGEYSKPRGLVCRELLGRQSVVDMALPVVSMRPNLGYKFLTAEAWWILTGRNDVSSIAPYSRHIGTFSNDGFMFDGAYGPKIVDQMRFAVDSITNDDWSRQSVIDIWRPNPRESKDTPCTLSVQFLLRPDLTGAEKVLRLHCVDTMRSSDAWLGWPYDVFNFSCLSAYVALRLRYKTGRKIELGNLYLNAGSQHLYECPKQDGVTNIPYEWDDVKKIWDLALTPEQNRTRWINVGRPYKRLNLDLFPSPQHFIDHLAACKDRLARTDWLLEFCQ